MARERALALSGVGRADLVICRAVVEIFRTEELRARLAWRGGTALHKLYLHPAARYSEDIDLVQVGPEPIGPTLDALRSVLDSWLGTPRRVFEEGRINLVYRFSSEGPPPVPLRLKIEINTREHFSEHGLVAVPFTVDSRWFRGSAQMTTFTVEELLGTKLHALYQRKKGRDLFDLWYALVKAEVDVEEIVACFQRYLRETGLGVSRAELERNLPPPDRRRGLERRAAGVLIIPCPRPGRPGLCPAGRRGARLRRRLRFAPRSHCTSSSAAGLRAVRVVR